MTNEGMAHEEASEALEALALDALDARERAGVLTHIASCAACRDEVTALQATVAQLSYAVRPVEMPGAQRDRVRARLLGRAATDRAPGQQHRPTPSLQILVPRASHEGAHRYTDWMTTKAAWIAMAASVVAAVSAAMLFQVSRERDALSDAYQLASVRTVVIDSLRASLDDRDRLIANLTGPQVAVVNLVSNDVRAPSARMFWDQSVNAWTFVAHNLPKPKLGRTYQLWLVTANAKISAGTFEPGPNGDAVVRATYALPKDALAAVAVTDEPAQGSAQPTTVPIIVGLNSTR